MACTSKQSLGGLLLCFCENWKAAVWQLWNGTDPHKTYQTHLVPSFGTMWSLWKLAHLAQSGCRVQIYLMDHGCRKLPYFKPTHTHRHTHTCTHAHTHTFTHTHTHTHSQVTHLFSIHHPDLEHHSWHNSVTAEWNRGLCAGAQLDWSKFGGLPFPCPIAAECNRRSACNRRNVPI